MFLKKKKGAEDVEISAINEGVVNEKKEETVATVTPAQSLEQEVAEPNEAFFGTVLIGCFVLSLVAATGYFGFTGYRYFKSIQSEKEIPSIAALPAREVEAEVVENTKETPQEEVSPVKGSEIDKKALEVKVLNGGAAKGVAGSYAEKLKKEGFEKTAIGNTFGSYTGAALYYAKGQESGMEVLKGVLLKDYPALLVKEAESGNKDTTAAPLTVILGR
jgi:LytR cell envelope-related transcriptional attenuator